MKKLLLVIPLFLILAFSPVSHALQGQGKVEDIKICGSGITHGWQNYVFFKLSDGNWFGIYANHNTNGGAEGNFMHSLLLTAFSMQLDVEANFSETTLTLCGITANMFWNNTTDYLHFASQ